MARLEVYPRPLRTMLHTPGEPVDHVYFPSSGFLSVVAPLSDGRLLEVSTVGKEGMVGVLSALGNCPSLSGTMVQGEGTLCHRMTARLFRSEMDRRGAFYDEVISYSCAHEGATMQTAACNAVHSVEQRLARWLLLAHDKMAVDDFALTQEFAAMMLGVTRPTVSVVAGALQKAGSISYRRGRISIVNRRRLESASCECYRVAVGTSRA